MVTVEARNITKKFGETLAVDNASFRANEEEFIGLLGPSGCGKTTTLRIVAGLEKPDAGVVLFDGKEVTHLPPEKRHVGFLFQRIALFPHMNVYDNVVFGLKMKRIPKEKWKKMVRDSLALVHMQGFEKRKISQVSGGEAQRVALARALVADPDVLLLDEPLSSIDARLRDTLKYEIWRLQRKTRKTAIYVTHDQAEAFAICDRIYIIDSGKVAQVGTPMELYQNPRTKFVADFIGDNNFYSGSIVDINPLERTVKVSCEDFDVQVPLPPHEPKLTDRVLVCIRPEDIDVITEAGRIHYRNVVTGKVETSAFLGSVTRLMVNVGRSTIKVDAKGLTRFTYANSAGKEVLLGFNACSLL